VECVGPADLASATRGTCSVEWTRDAAASRATLIGDLEAASADRVEDVLRTELMTRPARLEISLRELEFVDSAGLRMLLVLQRNAQLLGVPLSISGPQGAVRRTLEFARALDYLGIED
jgi:HptB-dependent secretion and biofilm anti anti-sigma factor